jgi:hypothetical protein
MILIISKIMMLENIQIISGMKNSSFQNARPELEKENDMKTKVVHSNRQVQVLFHYTMSLIIDKIIKADLLLKHKNYKKLKI